MPRCPSSFPSISCHMYSGTGTSGCAIWHRQAQPCPWDRVHWRLKHYIYTYIHWLQLEHAWLMQVPDSQVSYPIETYPSMHIYSCSVISITSSCISAGSSSTWGPLCPVMLCIIHAHSTEGQWLLFLWHYITIC